MKRKILSEKLKIHLFNALKIGFGSALAIFICAGLNLPNPASAGTITLLTLGAHTRRQTLKLILRRWISFLITIVISLLILPFIQETYLAYTLFLVIEVFILEILGWEDTLSVNAVIGVYFLINKDFSFMGILNEFSLLMISISIALVLNLIQPDLSDRQRIEEQIHHIEKELEEVLVEAKEILQKETTTCSNSKKKLEVLEEDLPLYISNAVRYEQNTFDPSDQWFSHYFETRLAQCAILDQLFRHIETAKKDSKDYVEHTAAFVNVVIATLPKSELPEKELQTGEELRTHILADKENETSLMYRAALLDVIQNLQQFLTLKKNFIYQLNPETRDGWYHCKLEIPPKKNDSERA